MNFMETRAKADLEKDNKPIYAIRLDQIMRRRGLTNKMLAESLYVAETTISGYRSGRRAPDPERMKEICLAVPVSANYLLGITDNPNL